MQRKEEDTEERTQPPGLEKQIAHTTTDHPSRVCKWWHKDISCMVVTRDNMSKNFSQTRELLLSSLSQFYNAPHTIEQIIPIIEGHTDAISLRLLDWFVTNYAKKYDVRLPRKGNSESTHVYLSYRSQLKAYSKQHFDPFRRRNRLVYYYTPQDSIETTIGQLNFFRWVLQNDILNYIRNNLSGVEGDMVKYKVSSSSRRTALTRRDTKDHRHDSDDDNEIDDNTEAVRASYESTQEGRHHTSCKVSKRVCEEVVDFH